MRPTRRLPRNAGKRLALSGVVGHHGLELAAGIGLPGEPVLGRRRAAAAWAGVLAAWAAADRTGRASAAVVAANGAVQALALQHYLYWPWRWRLGLPILTEAEGLPGRWLPFYNAALLAMVAGTTMDTASHAPDRWSWHLVGLATLPAQYGSARHHALWLLRSRLGGPYRLSQIDPSASAGAV